MGFTTPVGQVTAAPGTGTTVSLGVQAAGPGPVTVEWAAQPPPGVTVTPSSGQLTLPATRPGGRTARATVELSVTSSAPGTRPWRSRCTPPAGPRSRRSTSTWRRAEPTGRGTGQGRRQGAPCTHRGAALRHPPGPTGPGGPGPLPAAVPAARPTGAGPAGMTGGARTGPFGATVPRRATPPDAGPRPPPAAAPRAAARGRGRGGRARAGGGARRRPRPLSGPGPSSSSSTSRSPALARPARPGPPRCGPTG